ncbi:hypothetical protein Tco_1540234 [Tanacetum coccineum]
MRSMRLLLSLSSCDLCLCLRCRLVPSCFVIFDLEPLSLSFDLEAFMPYALTVNPTIYTSCIKQFWATAKAKTVNGEVQIQALVDGTKLTLMGYENLTQKLIFYKAFFSPQWKFLIHTILQCLSAKTTAWNEFSSTMASAVISLATNQKFNFSRYIFDNMVKNLEDGVKFLMYPRFVQVFLDNQVKGITKHKEIYVIPSHTKKVFANMKREGKGFFGRVTLLFQTMMVEAPEELEPITNEAANKQHVPTHSNDPLLSGQDEGLGAQDDASKQGRKIADLDAYAEEVEVKKTLIEIKVAKPKAVTTAATKTTTAVTRPKARGVIVQELSEFTKTTSPSQLSQLPQAKGKGKERMIELEKPLKKKDQILIDEEIAQNLQAQLNTELDEEEKLEKQREEDANIAK